MVRNVLSTPEPGPVGTTNSICRSGFQSAAIAIAVVSASANAQAIPVMRRVYGKYMGFLLRQV